MPKDYFYVIVPLEYRSAGGPPASWFIADLMDAMQLPYYVGLLSAAAQHGASHQQPQEFQVVTDRSVRPLLVGRAKLRFFASRFVEKAAVLDVKTPTGRMRVASPETTAVDLVRFSRSAGGLDNVAVVLAELRSSLDPQKLLAAVRLVADVPNVKRLGHILDRAGARRLAKPLRDWLAQQSPRLVPLNPAGSLTGAQEDRRWHVLVNQSVEVKS